MLNDEVRCNKLHLSTKVDTFKQGDRVFAVENHYEMLLFILHFAHIAFFFGPEERFSSAGGSKK
ncbi:hypothetical protein [Desulfofundulus thermosubterraneus]|uniref:Uncharacterized protein n=1 Tax=Desulfofundulus thermosubterraneus DSM 16057 TaxID=1121432 RepID=A0A1M6E0A4_9FIRM|nr:hypothetical protein [Desulfofundulus thermosubterraneus]SHI78881.1 hypothetical protein SAMN02745219_01080 [Desulfofundulus thermosubterraneus DSM 16057]